MDENLKKKIDAATYILKTGRRKFYGNDMSTNLYSYYINTNENLNYYGMLQQEIGLDMNGKDVLVPTASGDHAINAIFFDANSVETFDINELTFFNYDLKETAIKCLPRSQFLEFFTKKYLCRDIYDKIAKYLHSDTKEFFDGIYDFIESEPAIRDYLYDDYMKHLIEEWNAIEKSRFIACNPYLKSAKNYYSTREKILKLNKPVIHKLCSAHNIGDFFEPKHVIIFSNILRYYFDMSYYNKDFNIESYRSPVAQKLLYSLSKVLTDDGFASLLYSYKSCLKSEDDDIFDKLWLNSKSIYVPNKDMNYLIKDRIDIVTKAELLEKQR